MPEDKSDCVSFRLIFTRFRINRRVWCVKFSPSIINYSESHSQSKHLLFARQRKKKVHFQFYPPPSHTQQKRNSAIFGLNMVLHEIRIPVSWRFTTFNTPVRISTSRKNLARFFLVYFRGRRDNKLRAVAEKIRKCYHRPEVQAIPANTKSRGLYKVFWKIFSPTPAFVARAV